ncbi:MAG: helix-turn-helix domain-containing protein [Longimicrobiales bacterium]|nr:helix-turn-helix domain-containing protein [Longimicrobiales bacterium]
MNPLPTQHRTESPRSAGIDAADLLRSARARAGLSQRDLAHRAGTSQSVVARIELGQTSPTVSTLNRLLEAAGFRPVVDLGEKEGAAEELVRRLRGQLQRESPPGLASVYLFGSTAREAQHRESDVDVAVLLDRSVYPDRSARTDLRVRLSSRLVAVLGRNDVDLVVLNDLPALFARSIVLGGRKVIAPIPELDHAFVRDVQLRAADLEPFLRRTRAIKLQALMAEG